MRGKAPRACGGAPTLTRTAPVRPPAHARTHARRDFVLSSYAELKKANPAFPILVRECSGVEARLVARYGESWVCGRGCGSWLASATAPALRHAGSAHAHTHTHPAWCCCCRPEHRPDSAPQPTPPLPLPLSDFGREEVVSVEGLGKGDVAKQLEALVKKGEGMPRSTESEGKL